METGSEIGEIDPCELAWALQGLEIALARKHFRIR